LNHCGFDKVVVTHRTNGRCGQNVPCICGEFGNSVEYTFETDADSICTIAAAGNLTLGFEEGFNRNCDDRGIHTLLVFRNGSVSGSN